MDKYPVFSKYKNEVIDPNILLLTNNPIEKELLHSLDNVPIKRMELDKLIIYIKVLEVIYYYDDAEQILKDIVEHTDDIAQINTLKKIIKNKPIKQQKESSIVVISRSCPHCGQKTYGNDNVPYIVCGYNIKGFDWKGCGRDWCFKCGKKLCKNWNINSLFNKLNRYHDSKCCKKHAIKMGFAYPDEFCMCQNEIVNRMK